MKPAIGPALTAGIPSPDWTGFTIGPLTIHAYALCILTGIAAGLWLTSARWKQRGGPQDAVWDIVVWAIPFGIIGGRLYHVVSSPDAYFGPNGDLSLIPQIWRGGLGIWGAVALGLLGAWIGCRRSGVRLTSFMDAAAPGLLLAQAIGRWGNWFNQELYGGPTTLPWGLQIDPGNPDYPAGLPAGTLFHPTFLYESLWNLLGVGILLLLDRRFGFRGGRLFWLYAAYYTLGRVWIEAMRIDDAELVLGLRLNIWTSILVFIFSIAAFIALGREQRKAGPPRSVYLPGQPAEDGNTMEREESRKHISSTNDAAGRRKTDPAQNNPERRDPQ
ncbi:prolipoprotein diacylglyceryl transferase [Arthrobacter crystallopoietes]|uniref:Phosphatidylglycerol--prolipoprotein diacylglyceryl transferase n=1 Tax=Crystallibacter crystallopoietes TaxID=37928 RepID=A0A1H1FYX0_9MICC|nr:prolipoprotein diacylglyceryl transferase [Arthrobacter crystallopoietes]SDR05979.1 prolipoprotein diacylglyceryl transferase [Arthrobacter crystallopoietes]